MTIEVIHGDALEVLRGLPDASHDSLVTDPPSAIGFMGAEWDGDKGGMDEWVDWLEDILAEAWRVLKPGAYGFVWALPRTSHWTGLAIERAGFEIDDQFDHIFGSGFPKALDASKAIDDHDFRQWLHANPAELELHRKTRRRCKELKQSKGRAWNHGTETRATFARKLRKRVDRMQRRRAGLLRKVVSSYTASGNAGTPTDEKGGTYVTGAPNSEAVELHIEEGATERSHKWDGFKCAVKPAHEVWWLVQKPLEGTVARNLLKYGCGALNIDACRVATDWKDRPDSWKSSGNSAKPEAEKIAAPPGEGIQCHPKGRFPAHLLLTHAAECGEVCVAGCPVLVLGEQSGEGVSGALRPYREQHQNATSYQLDRDKTFVKPADSGTAARYFKQFRPDPPFYYTPKPSTAEREGGLRAEGDAARANIHPTVKSEELMRYLVRLITPPGGKVLDCFAGSGSTGVAAAKEQLSATLIELNDSEQFPYVTIARARIAHALDSKEARQGRLFG